jgi:hypothetical protein
MSKTLRFNISPEMTDALVGFHTNYKDLGKDEYKKQWEQFIQDNSDLIAQEERTLVNAGFNGDITHKMFTSVRYYLSKKTNDKRDPKERRAYVHIDKQILEAMDTHIVSNKDDDTFTPAKGYKEFYETNEQELIIERSRLKTSSELTDDEIDFKIKKTYKNRYFILCK